MFASLMIVDPHSVFCQVVRSLIEKRKDLGVMSEASDGHRASDKAREFRPDVIPTEILLPNRNGINLISRLSEADNRARVAAQSRREGRSEADQAHAAVAAAPPRRGRRAPQRGDLRRHRRREAHKLLGQAVEQLALSARAARQLDQ